MTLSKPLFALAFITTTAAGCEKKPEKAATDKGVPAAKVVAAEPAVEASQTSTVPAGWTWTALPKVGLTIATPAATELMEQDGPSHGVKIGEGWITVREATDGVKSLDEAKSQVEADESNKLTKQATTADGWHLEFDEAGKEPEYGVVVRRTIGGKPIDCTITDYSAATRDLAAKACASLKAP